MLRRERKKGREAGITFEQYLELLGQRCVYCGTDELIVLDRINNALGYTAENVVAACDVCNSVRNAIFTVDEMKRLGVVIAELRGERDAFGIPGFQFRKKNARRSMSQKARAR